MLGKTVILALSIAVAGPVAASDQIRQSLDLAPGAYTTHEMVELMAAGGGERKQRVKLIHKERQAFAEAVHEVMTAGGGVLSTAGTR